MYTGSMRDYCCAVSTAHMRKRRKDMKKRRTLRLLALLLCILLTMQCMAAAAEPGETPAEPGETPGEPGETPGDPDDPPPAEEIPAIAIVADLDDGQVVNTPRPVLTVEAIRGEESLPAEQITVLVNGAAAAPAEGVFPLKLEPGDNVIEITAGEGEEKITKTLTVRYEIAIPDGWAHDALQFCVENGILKGDQNGDLMATSNATRAELPAMLVRLFNAMPMDSLSGFSDVPESEWFHDEMARAVAMGIYKGSGGKLTPKNRITREEAFVVLARAFGVVSASEDALSKVPDRDKISAWARHSIAGMLEAGYVNGYKDGSVNPKGYITRQELAQVLYNALDCITDDPEQLTGSRCLYTGPAAGLEGKTVNGSLIISCPDTGDLTLNSLKVSDRLVLHLHEVKKATLGDVCGTVSLVSPAALTLTQSVDTVNFLRDGGEVTADAALAVVDGAATLHGDYDRVVVVSGKAVIADDASADKVETYADRAGLGVTVDGHVGELHAGGKDVTVDGKGKVDTLYQYRTSLTASCEVGQTVDRVDAGLDGVKIVPGEKPEAFYDVPTVTVTGTVSGVNSKQVYGVDGGVRTCTVTYRYGGKVIKTDTTCRLTEGAKLSCEVTPNLTYKASEEQDVTVTITYKGETVTGPLKLVANGRFTPLNEAKNIRTCYVTAEVTYSTGIYSYSSRTGYIGSVSKGTIVYFLKTDGSSALIQTTGGLRGWVPDSAVRVGWRTYHDDSVSYTTEGKEAFVNQLHDYSSSSNYLLWVNLYTTTVNIFEGSKGNWKLIKTCECVIGAPNTPTRPGVYSIYSKTGYWHFDATAPGRNDASRCYNISLFDGGIAFHTRLKYTRDGSFVNSALSAELSHGCVRCPDDIAQFIYYNCAIGTRVVVW